MKKKTLKLALCYLSAFAMLASGVVSASASDLTAEELFDKYGDQYCIGYEPDSGMFRRQVNDWYRLMRAPYNYTLEDLISALCVEDEAEWDLAHYVLGFTTGNVRYGSRQRGDDTPEDDSPSVIYVNHEGEPYEGGVPQADAEWANVDIMNTIYRCNPYCYRQGMGVRASTYCCAYADGFYYAEYEPGKATIAGVDLAWLETNAVTKLVIPAEIAGLTVTRIECSAFDELGLDYNAIEEFVLPDTIEEIQSNAFANAIGKDAFAKINLPKNLKVIGERAFCNSFDYMNVGVHAQYRFAGCDDNTVVLPDSVELISDAFNSGMQLVLPDSPVLALGGHWRSTAEDEEYDYLRTANGEVSPYLYTYQDAFFYQIDKVRAGELPTCWTTCTDENGEEFYTDGEKFAELHPQFYQSAAVEPKPVTVQGTGDLDGDGKVSISDAILLSRYVAEDATVSITTEGIAQADLDGSGIIDAGDIATVLKQIAGL